MITVENGQIFLSMEPRKELRFSLNFKPGDFVLIIGSNGSGKTSFLDTIAGVKPLSNGNIFLAEGIFPIGYAVQESGSGLLPWETILSNILLPAKILKKEFFEIENKAKRLLQDFRLLDRAGAFPYQLSGGEKQAVNLMRALCTPGKLFLFDEVLASLHNDLKMIARKEISYWNKASTSILVSHDQADLELPFNRFFFISNGILEEIGREGASQKITYVT